VVTAQTALTLATLSGNRFILGLGVSGPQVVEGLHGVPFAHPLGRLRETIAIIRQAFAGERITYQGKHFVLPRPGGEGKALRLSLPPNPHIPIYLATLAPKMLELTGELADGWIGTSFIPEQAAAFTTHLAAGAARAGRTLADLDFSQGGDVAFTDDVDAFVAARKSRLAFSLGGMGSATTNFYNEAYSRQGWAEVAAEVQRLWVAGKRQEAAAVIPDAMVLQTTMIGTEAMVRDRMRVWRDAGITTLRVYPAGQTLDARLTTLGRVIDIVAELNRET
jgi:F420-dependent oxidoreductase-like protein